MDQFFKNERVTLPFRSVLYTEIGKKGELRVFFTANDFELFSKDQLSAFEESLKSKDDDHSSQICGKCSMLQYLTMCDMCKDYSQFVPYKGNNGLFEVSSDLVDKIDKVLEEK